MLRHTYGYWTMKGKNETDTSCSNVKPTPARNLVRASNCKLCIWFYLKGNTENGKVISENKSLQLRRLISYSSTEEIDWTLDVYECVQEKEHDCNKSQSGYEHELMNYFQVWNSGQIYASLSVGLLNSLCSKII